MLPNGIFAEIWGPHLGRDHDARLLHESNFVSKLNSLPRPSNYQEDEPVSMPFSVYGDPAYPLSQFIQRPFQAAQLTPQRERFNRSMSKARQSVEWGFGGIISLWAFLDFKKNQKVLLQQVAKMYLVAGLLTNVKNCIEVNQVSLYFGLPPPLLEDYLNGYLV
jgi:hypothetical protein